jgi:hypothetical protein
VVASSARGLRAKITYNPRLEKYVWHLRDAEGQTMAAGEEFLLRNAFEAAHDSVFAVQMWTMFGRGVLWSPRGQLDFAFAPRRTKIDF